MRPLNLILGAALLLPVPANAQQCGEQIMSCTLRGATKQAQVCLNGLAAVYRFGPVGGTPELTLSSPIETVDYRPWPGIGRNIVEVVRFSNGPYTYAVATGFERGPNEDDPDGIPQAFGGIIITKDGADVATLACDAGSVTWSYGGGLYDAKTAIGQCWKRYPDDRWIACQN